MLRKLPLAMAIALAVMPIQSQALGLGKIKTNSLLNQPFDAEIQLLSVPPGELDGVKVELGSSQAFERAGIERPFLLSRLKFETTRKPNGDAVINVYSRESIQEPFLNFLVEVNWPKGRMVREFTVLLDPPLTTGQKAAPVSTPTATAVSQSRVTGTRALQPERIPAVAADGQYGPVQQNETLWSISDRYRPSGVSVHQMMIAILEANPQAFNANNINTLKAGSVLRIPTSDEIGVSAQDALQMANQQYRDWKQGLGQPVVEETPAAAVAEPETKPAQEPAIAEEPAAATVEETEESARLKLSGSEVASQMGTGEDTDVEGIKQELLTTQEKLVSAESEAEELRGVMGTLEDQLADMKRLLELKDEQLAKMQAEGAAMPEADAMVAEEPMAEAPAEEMVTEEAAEPEPAPVAEEVAEAPEPVAETAAPVEEETAPPPPARQEGIIDMITGSATMMGIAVAVLVVLIALIWSIFSRRKETQEAAPETADKATEAAAAAEPAADEHADDETSFLSEFTPADLESLQDQETGEVDPISEADVYIAYGRFDQAEDLVKQALENEPGKISYQHKLLEIYYANKDTEKFVALANEMHEHGAEASDPDAWNRAKLMGIDLDPENAMFADAMDVPSMEVGDDLDMALSELESQLKSDTDSSLADLEDETSEQLEDLNLDEMASQLEEEAASGADSMSLDLDALNKEEVKDEDEIKPLPDVDLDASSTTAADDEAKIEELAAELESFDLDAVDTADASIQTPEGEDLTAAEEVALPEEESLEDLSAELDEIDDVTTKIDLARAYIEMGDKEGAKGILEEVLEEGSDAQKQEAQNLISEM